MLWILGAAALLAASGAGLAWISRRMAVRYALTTPSDEFHQAPTSDGWLIGLHRYLPGGRPAGGQPVLLCHGLLSSRFSLDLLEEQSLARHLRGAGFDVWLMDLRGHGDSVRQKRSRRGYDWSLDDYVKEDLPAAVSYVLKATGQPQIHWVGHSLGGMLLYAHCLDGDRSCFRSAVAIDSPGHLLPYRQPARIGRLYTRLVPVVPVLLFKPIFHLIQTLVPERILMRDLQLDRETLRLVLYNALIDTGSSRALLHLSKMVAAGRFQSLDGEKDYEAGAARIDFPLLVLRAPRSGAPEVCVRRPFELAGTREKRYVSLGRENGCSMDHNHFSVVLGRSAAKEVFPLIVEWLRCFSSPALDRDAGSAESGAPRDLPHPESRTCEA